MTLRWECATQTDYVRIMEPGEQLPQPAQKKQDVSVADLVNDLHEKQKGLDVHELSMKQVELEKDTLKKQHELEFSTLKKRLE